MRRLAFYFSLGLLLGLAWMSTSAQIAVTSTGGTATSVSSTAWPLTAPNAGALRTGTTANDTLLLQAYDVDGAAYTTLLTLTAGNTPTLAFGGYPTFTNGLRASTKLDFNYFATNRLGLTSDSYIAWVASTTIDGTSDLVLRRDDAATLQLGVDVNGSAIAQTLKAHDGIAGTDIAGASLTLAGGRGTGAGAPGSLIFQTATALGSGTTAQTLATRLIIGPTGAATFGTTAGTGTGAVYADTFYTGTTVGCSGTPTVATKGIATTCTEPVPEPLTQSEVNELRGLLSVMRGKA